MAQFGLRRLLPSSKKKHNGKEYEAVTQKDGEKLDGSKIQIRIDLCSDEDSVPSIAASMDSLPATAAAKVLLNLRPPDQLMPTDEAEEDEAHAAEASGSADASTSTLISHTSMQPKSESSNRITQGGINLDQDICNPTGITQQWLSAQQFHVKPHDTEHEFTGERRVSISDSTLYCKRGPLLGSREVSISKSVRRCIVVSLNLLMVGVVSSCML
jgi:hypothetical protein